MKFYQDKFSLYCSIVSIIMTILIAQLFNYNYVNIYFFEHIIIIIKNIILYT